MKLIDLHNKRRLNQYRKVAEAEIIYADAIPNDVFPTDTPMSVGSEGTTVPSITGGTPSIESSDFIDGVSSFKMEAIFSTSCYYGIDFNYIKGKHYTLNFWAKQPIGTTARIYCVSPIKDSTTLIGTCSNSVWTEYTFEIVADNTDTTGLRIYCAFGGSLNDVLLLDKVSVIESTIDGDAQIFIDAVATLTTAEEVAINNLVVGLKANGTWSKYKAIYPFIGGTASSHKWNLKDPFDLDVSFRLSFNGTVTHDASGIIGDGSTGYADTYFIPSSNITFNSESLGIYSNTDNVVSSVDVVEFGAYSGASQASLIAVKDQSNNYKSRLNSQMISVSNTDAKGNYTVSKNGSTDLRMFKNGVLINNGVSDGSLSSNKVFLLTLNLSGSPYSSGYSTQRIAFSSIADGFTDTQALYDSVLIQEYQEALGRAVSIGTEVFPQDSAYSLADLNSTGSMSSGSGLTVEVEETEVYNGTYAIKFTDISDGAYNYIGDTFPVTAGKTYLIKIWAKTNVTSIQGFFVRGADNSTVVSNIFPTTEWKQYIFTYTEVTTGNATIRWYSALGTGGNVGDILYIDEVSIIELD